MTKLSHSLPLKNYIFLMTSQLLLHKNDHAILLSYVSCTCTYTSTYTYSNDTLTQSLSCWRGKIQVAFATIRSYPAPWGYHTYLLRLESVTTRLALHARITSHLIRVLSGLGSYPKERKPGVIHDVCLGAAICSSRFGTSIMNWQSFVALVRSIHLKARNSRYGYEATKKFFKQTVSKPID